MSAFKKIYVIDPNLFYNWSSKNCLLAICKLQDWFDDKEIEIEFKLDSNHVIEGKYENILNSFSGGSTNEFLGNLLVRKILDKNITPETMVELRELSPQETAFLDNSEFSLSEIEKVLIRLALQIPELTILLTDPSYNHTGLYNPKTKEYICYHLLKRKAILYASDFIRPLPRIFTEGESDWKHLIAALRKLRERKQFLDLDLEFDECANRRGSPALLNLCRQSGSNDNKQVLIYMFDRDEPHILKDVINSDKDRYKYWDHKRYTFAIPIPDHRKDQESYRICIEFYYKDPEMKQKDNNGRRLFTTTEFNPKTGWHNTEDLVYRGEVKLGDSISIIDCGVFNKSGSVALSKDAFAKNILNQAPNFNNFDFAEFEKIFTIIVDIIADDLRQS